MSKKKFEEKNSGKSPAEGYYTLHTQAIDDLVNASKENTPQFSEEELQKYTSARGKFRLPAYLKVCLAKAWFYGAICYFSFFGLGMYAADQLDLYFVSAIIMGMTTDLILSRLLRFLSKTEGGEKKYLFVTASGTKGFFLNILYAFLLLFMVITFYSALNALVLFVTEDANRIIGVEPVLFGLIAMLADMLLISMKHLMIKIIDDAKRAG